MLEFRHHAERIIRRIERGERLVLTYRGRPAIRLEPLNPPSDSISADDPLLELCGLVSADQAGDLMNESMDEVIYGHRDVR